MRCFFQKLLPYAIIFLLLQTLLRISLLARSALEVDFSALDLLQIILRGLWFDLVTLPWILLPFALFFLLCPTLIPLANQLLSRGRYKPSRLKYFGTLLAYTLFLFALFFDAVSEHIFWSEFTARFNFIAVDYLIYTQEVIGNIRESYPVGWILSFLALLALSVAFGLTRNIPLAIQELASTQPLSTNSFTQRMAAFALFLCFIAGTHLASDADQAKFNNNTEASELAANGIYNLFHAFWHNEIEYKRFYAQHEETEVTQRIRTLLAQANTPLAKEPSLTRTIPAYGAEQHKNVIVIVMESMSADYMAHFGNTENLTPNLDHLADQGLLFTQAYATGTRTVRALEAVTLSIPPTPGQSILRRKNNNNLFSLGSIMKERGYETSFIYGGYGYFDNMNAFFSGNGFNIVDRTQLAKDEIHSANVWGIADEDLFARVVKEADRAHHNHTPFLHIVMTTSNHRPYTYPEGRIDIPSKSGRNGGVKYADYSVGKLIEWASTKPWFNNTLFVFVADHTAGAGGKAELDAQKYHIPIIFYAPKMIPSKRYDKLTSQIDIAPMILGQLHLSYDSKFYGQDLLHEPNVTPRAFISNYQKVALVQNDALTVLAPKQEITQYTWPGQEPLSEPNISLIDDTIAYYQSASWWKRTYREERD